MYNNYNQPVLMVPREKIQNYNKTSIGVVLLILFIFAIIGLGFIVFCTIAFPELH